MSEPVFEAYVEDTNYADVVGVFGRATSVSGDILPDSITASFLPMVSKHDQDMLASIVGAFDPVRGFITDIDTSGAVVAGAFKPIRALLTSIDLDPTINIINADFASIESAITTRLTTYGDVLGSFQPIRGVLTDIAGNLMIGAFQPATSFIWQRPTYVGTFGIFQSPGILAIATDSYDFDVMSLFSRIDAEDNTILRYAIALFDQVVGSTALRLTPWHAGMKITEHPVVRAITNFVVGVVCESAGVVTSTLEETRRVLSVMSDILLAAGVVETPYQARVALSAFARLSSTLTAIEYMPLDDEAIADTLLDIDTRLMANVLDGAQVADGLIGNLSVLVVSASALVAADQIVESLQGGMALLDEAFVGGRFTFDGIPYTVYAMTAVGSATSEIQGWDYDSFFKIGDVAYATSPRGIVRLDGDTDEGSEINAALRVGMSNLGTALEKRMPNAYVGYTSTGRLALGVVSNHKGVKKQNWYALPALPQAATAERRFDIAKGLNSVYWDFEIRNLEGADFELDFIKVWQVRLSRRKQS